MTVYENTANTSFAPGNTRPARGIALHPVHEAAMRLAGAGLSKSRGRTRDLVALLLSHGARAWRQSQPEVQIHMHVAAYMGRRPVRLRIGEK
ncbi:MAG TPA: hypothetical protein VGO22_08305 [Pseudorhizobium sp.]|jgi:hypothetical protein|nr:hypothetical protein [Pseudorhizobium sp.]